jgi:hypothetical protein
MLLLSAIAITGVVFAAIFIALTHAGFDKDAALALAGLANTIVAPLHEALKKRDWKRMTASPAARRLWPINSYFLNWVTAVVYTTTIALATNAGITALMIWTVVPSSDPAFLRFSETIALGIIAGLSLLNSFVLAGLAFMVGLRILKKGNLAIVVSAGLMVLYWNNVSNFGLNQASPEQVAALIRTLPWWPEAGWFSNWLLLYPFFSRPCCRSTRPVCGGAAPPSSVMRSDACPQRLPTSSRSWSPKRLSGSVQMHRESET